MECITVDPATFTRIRNHAEDPTVEKSYIIIRSNNTPSLSKIKIQDGWNRVMYALVQHCTEWNGCGDKNFEYSVSYFALELEKTPAYLLTLDL
jgi:hypothetical protein